MADENVETPVEQNAPEQNAPEQNAPEQDAPDQDLTRKERAAARRAEFEAAKAAKNTEKSAAKAEALEEKLAAKQAKQALAAAAKAAKTAKSDVGGEDVGGKPRKQKTPKVKVEKDPYRPRFAVAPGKVRALTVFAGLLALLHAAGAALLLLEASSSLLGVLPDDMAMLAYLYAAVSALTAVLWVLSATLLCSGRTLGRTLGFIAVVLGIPFSLVAAPLLFSSDVRDWAL